MRKPLLSVIVPVYNTAPWLRRCLDSICTQTYTNLEILCVNDGSTDNSAEILAEYAAKDSRIRVFTQKNAGLSAARNTALEHATGEWVTGVDSDDYIEPGVYERSMVCIADTVDMVFFGVQTVNEEGEALPDNSYFALPAAGEHDMTPELAERLNVCFWSKLWRRSLLEENNLRFPHSLVHEDEALYYLALPYARTVAVSPVCGYYYVQRSGSIMNSGAAILQKIERYLQVIRFVHAECKKRALPPEKSPWFKLMITRIYRDSFNQTTETEREFLQQPFHQLLQELQLLPHWKRDYRVRCMVPPNGWRRLFLSRYLHAELYRFFGVPVWLVEYRNGVATRHSCMLGSAILRKLGFRKPVSGKR